MDAASIKSIGLDLGAKGRVWSSSECRKLLRRAVQDDAGNVTVIWSGNGWRRMPIPRARFVFEGYNLQTRRERLIAEVS